MRVSQIFVGRETQLALLCDNWVPGEKAVFEIAIGGTPVGLLDLPVGGVLPGVSVDGRTAAVWGSNRVFVAVGRQARLREFADDVLCVYPLDGQWLVVTQLGAVAVDQSLEDAGAAWVHDEIITSFRRDGGAVIVSDLQEREFLLDVDPNRGVTARGRH